MTDSPTETETEAILDYVSQSLYGTQVRGGSPFMVELERRINSVIQLALDEKINTPHIKDFTQSVKFEAVHQYSRWSDDDKQKTNEQWFWGVGYLAGKALHAAITGDIDKAKHHTISTAAMLLHWHKQLSE